MKRKQVVRSVRLTDDEAAKLARLVELERKRSEIWLLRPRKEGVLLGDAIAVGLSVLLERSEREQ